MPTDPIFSARSLEVLKLGLDAFALRGRVIARNIANIATPGYRAGAVSFEEDLRRALSAGEPPPRPEPRPGHIPVGAPPLEQVEPRIVETPDPALLGDPNNVIVEREMADLARNQLLFEAASKMVAGHYRTLKAAIRGSAR